METGSPKLMTLRFRGPPVCVLGGVLLPAGPSLGLQSPSYCPAVDIVFLLFLGKFSAV